MSVVETKTVDGSGSAVFSGDGRYRYRLERNLEKTIGEPVASSTILWVMLNPSLAGADEDDATIRKVKGFSSRWGYRRIVVVNLFTLITPYPIELALDLELNGPQADKVFADAISEADRIVCAWGNPPSKKVGVAARTADLWSVMTERHDFPFWCLGRNASGTPKHPGRLAYATPVERFGS